MCGTGLAAQFPSTSSHQDEDGSYIAAVPARRDSFFTGQSQNSRTNLTDKPQNLPGEDIEELPPDDAPVLANPQQRYAKNAAPNGFVVAEPEQRIGKYSPSPTFLDPADEPKKAKRNQRPSGFADSSPVLSGTKMEIVAKKPELEPFESMDYSVFKKSELGLSLEKSNPFFSRKPPRSTAAPLVSINLDEIVPLPHSKISPESAVATQNVNEPYTQKPADTEKPLVFIDLVDIVPANQVQNRSKISSEPIVNIDLSDITPARRTEAPLISIPWDEIQPFNKNEAL